MRPSASCLCLVRPAGSKRLDNTALHSYSNGLLYNVLSTDYFAMSYQRITLQCLIDGLLYNAKSTNSSYPSSSSSLHSYLSQSLYSHVSSHSFSSSTSSFQCIITMIHSFNADIYIAPLQVGLLRSAPSPSAAK